MRTNHQPKDRRRGVSQGVPARGPEGRKPEAKVRPVRSADAALPAGPAGPDPAGSPPAEIHFGVLLRRARERRGLSLQQVAQITRIADRWMPALEEARLDQLPAPVFVAGYVRSYARAVGLDESDLLERYKDLAQQRGAGVQALVLLPERTRSHDMPWRRALLLALPALLMMIGVLWALLRR